MSEVSLFRYSERYRSVKEESPIFEAIQKVNVLCVRIAEGHKLDVTSLTGKRPLHLAVLRNTAAIPILIQAGCDVNARDTVHGNAPLHVACSLCNREAIFLLIQAGAVVNVKNNNDETPLWALLRSACPTRRNFHSVSRETLGRCLVGLGMKLTPPGKDQRKKHYKVVQLYERMRRESRKVPSLQHLSRLAVRAACEEHAEGRAVDLKTVFKDLEISCFLRDYLLFKPHVIEGAVYHRNVH